jgi:hypothetical protein
MMSAAHEVGQGAADRRIEEMRLAAALRRGFRHAQVLMAHSLAEYDLSALSYHLPGRTGWSKAIWPICSSAPTPVPRPWCATWASAASSEL